MAPEMILGIGYNAAVDWWALGALAHEMLTGKAPFESKNIKVLQKKIISEKVIVILNSSVGQPSIQDVPLLVLNLYS